MVFYPYAAKFSEMCPSSSIPNRRRFNKWACFCTRVKTQDGTYRFVSDTRSYPQPLEQRLKARFSQKIFKVSVRNYEMNVQKAEIRQKIPGIPKNIAIIFSQQLAIME